MSGQPPPALGTFRMALATLVICAWFYLSAQDVARPDFTVDWPWHAIVGVIVAGIYPDGARLFTDAIRAVIQFWKNGKNGTTT